MIFNRVYENTVNGYSGSKARPIFSEGIISTDSDGDNIRLVTNHVYSLIEKEDYTSSRAENIQQLFSSLKVIRESFKGKDTLMSTLSNVWLRYGYPEHIVNITALVNTLDVVEDRKLLEAMTRFIISLREVNFNYMTNSSDTYVQAYVSPPDVNVLKNTHAELYRQLVEVNAWEHIDSPDKIWDFEHRMAHTHWITRAKTYSDSGWSPFVLRDKLSEEKDGHCDWYLLERNSLPREINNESELYSYYQLYIMLIGEIGTIYDEVNKRSAADISESCLDGIYRGICNTLPYLLPRANSKKCQLDKLEHYNARIAAVDKRAYLSDSEKKEEKRYIKREPIAYCVDISDEVKKMKTHIMQALFNTNFWDNSLCGNTKSVYAQFNPLRRSSIIFGALNVSPEISNQLITNMITSKRYRLYDRFDWEVSKHFEELTNEYIKAGVKVIAKVYETVHLADGKDVFNAITVKKLKLSQKQLVMIGTLKRLIINGTYLQPLYAPWLFDNDNYDMHNCAKLTHKWLSDAKNAPAFLMWAEKQAQIRVLSEEYIKTKFNTILEKRYAIMPRINSLVKK